MLFLLVHWNGHAYKKHEWFYSKISYKSPLYGYSNLIVLQKLATSQLWKKIMVN
jgi:hypothetical protein